MSGFLGGGRGRTAPSSTRWRLSESRGHLHERMHAARNSQFCARASSTLVAADALVFLLRQRRLRQSRARKVARCNCSCRRFAVNSATAPLRRRTVREWTISRLAGRFASCSCGRRVRTCDIETSVLHEIEIGIAATGLAPAGKFRVAMRRAPRFSLLRSRAFSRGCRRMPRKSAGARDRHCASAHEGAKRRHAARRSRQAAGSGLTRHHYNFPNFPRHVPCKLWPLSGAAVAPSTFTLLPACSSRGFLCHRGERDTCAFRCAEYPGGCRGASRLCLLLTIGRRRILNRGQARGALVLPSRRAASESKSRSAFSEGVGTWRVLVRSLLVTTEPLDGGSPVRSVYFVAETGCGRHATAISPR